MRTILFLLFAAAASPVYAYLDPGTGSMVLQMLIAGILSALFAIKMFWFRIKSFFTGESLPDETKAENEEKESDK